jgi:hypothetical protein
MDKTGECNQITLLVEDKTRRALGTTRRHLKKGKFMYLTKETEVSPVSLAGWRVTPSADLIGNRERRLHHEQIEAIDHLLPLLRHV